METGKGLSVAAKAAKKRVDFWAATLDAFLQDFLAKAGEDDRLGTIVAAARLAQVCEVMSQEYEANCAALVEGKTELRAAEQAAKLVLDMCEKNADECKKLLPGRDPDSLQLTGPGDGSLN